MKRHALFVGVDQYADPTIQDLNIPAEDATDLASRNWIAPDNSGDNLGVRVALIPVQ